MSSIYEKAIEVLEENANEDYLPVRVIADFIVLMPEDVRSSFDSYFSQKITDDKDKRGKLLELLASMKRDLKKREQEIESLFRGVA